MTNNTSSRLVVRQGGRSGSVPATGTGRQAAEQAPGGSVGSPVARIVAHGVGAVVFSGTWLVGINLPSGPVSVPLMVVGSVLPPAVAALSLLLAHHGATLTEAGKTGRVFSPKATERRAVTR